jgi:hypothetical protein
VNNLGRFRASSSGGFYPKSPLIQVSCSTRRLIRTSFCCTCCDAQHPYRHQVLRTLPATCSSSLVTAKGTRDPLVAAVKLHRGADYHCSDIVCKALFHLMHSINQKAPKRKHIVKPKRRCGERNVRDQSLTTSTTHQPRDPKKVQSRTRRAVLLLPLLAQTVTAAADFIHLVTRCRRPAEACHASHRNTDSTGTGGARHTAPQYGAVPTSLDRRSISWLPKSYSKVHLSRHKLWCAKLLTSQPTTSLLFFTSSSFLPSTLSPPFSNCHGQGNGSISGDCPDHSLYVKYHPILRGRCEDAPPLSAPSPRADRDLPARS